MLKNIEKNLTKEERIKKRYNAEKRFKLYGITSVVLAILFVVFLIYVIFSKGSSAFQKTIINVEINFTLDSLYLDPNPSKDDLENVEYYDLAIESLLKVYQVNGLKEEKALINLFSPDYEYEVRDFLIKNPEFINKKTILKLTASDDMDQLHKGNYPRHLP